MATMEGAEHRVRYVNPAFCRLMSKEREALIGKPFAEILPERGGCLALLDRVYLTGETESHTEPDGSAPHPLFWSYTMWPVRGAGERLMGVMLQVTETTKFHQRSVEMNEALMLGSVRQHELVEASDVLNAQLQDAIAERKQVEAALRASQAQLQTLFDGAPIGIYLIDADFRISAANPTALLAFGDISDLMGRDFDEVIHILWPKAKAEEIAKRFNHTLKTGEPYIVPQLIEKRVDRGVTEYYEWQISRIALPDDRFGVVCYFRDISQRVLAEQKIRESEERYRTLFASAPMAVFACDRNAVIQQYNARAVELWGREPTCGVEKHCGSTRLWLPDGTLDFLGRIDHHRGFLAPEQVGDFDETEQVRRSNALRIELVDPALAHEGDAVDAGRSHRGF
jgi:PAS domain S-box-containing protein